MSDKLQERFSQRSKERDEAIREFVKTEGRKPTDNEVAVLVRDTRPDKLHEISTAEVHARQLGRMSLEEHTNLMHLKETALAQSHSLSLEPDSAANALNHAEQHLFERKTVAKDHELLTEALRHSRGGVDLAALRGTYEFEVSRGTYLQTGGNVATEYSLARERAMVAVVNEGTDIRGLA